MENVSKSITNVIICETKTEGKAMALAEQAASFKSRGRTDGC